VTAAATPALPASVHVVDHPLVRDALTRLRDRATPPPAFRRAVRQIGGLLAYEATRTLATRMLTIETPLAQIRSPVLAAPPPCVIAILRAGLALADGVLDLLPEAPIGHVGLYRDPKTLRAVEYMFKVPADLDTRTLIVCDPMLATAHTAVAAVDRLKGEGAKALIFVAVLAARAGIDSFTRAHPDVPVICAAVDPVLNDHAYIVPGLGDAGDRQFGTG